MPKTSDIFAPTEPLPQKLYQNERPMTASAMRLLSGAIQRLWYQASGHAMTLAWPHPELAPTAFVTAEDTWATFTIDEDQAGAPAREQFEIPWVAQLRFDAIRIDYMIARRTSLVSHSRWETDNLIVGDGYTPVVGQASPWRGSTTLGTGQWSYYGAVNWSATVVTTVIPVGTLPASRRVKLVPKAASIGNTNVVTMDRNLECKLVYAFIRDVIIANEGS